MAGTQEGRFCSTATATFVLFHSPPAHDCVTSQWGLIAFGLSERGGGGHTKGSDAAPAVSASNSGFVTSSLAALAPGWKEQDAPVSLVNNCEPSVVLAFLLVPRSGFADNVGLGLPSFPNPLGRTTAKKARDGHRPHTSLRVHCLFSPPLHAEAASLIFSADLANAITKIRLSPLRETGFSSQFELFFSPLLSLHFRGRLFGAPTVFSNSLFPPSFSLFPENSFYSFCACRSVFVRTCVLTFLCESVRPLVSF